MRRITGFAVMLLFKEILSYSWMSYKMLIASLIGIQACVYHCLDYNIYALVVWGQPCCRNKAGAFPGDWYKRLVQILIRTKYKRKAISSISEPFTFFILLLQQLLIKLTSIFRGSGLLIWVEKFENHIFLAIITEM